MDTSDLNKRIGDVGDIYPMTQILFDGWKFFVDSNRTSLCWLSVLSKSDMDVLRNYANLVMDDTLKEDDFEKYEKEFMDFMTLATALVEFETGKNIDNISSKEIEDASIALSILITFEELKRDGFVTLSGNGKITDFHGNDSTRAISTKNGKEVSEGVDILCRITEMMESRE